MKLPDKLHLVSRGDVNDLLSSFSKHGFKLEDREWPSVEHYFQAMKFDDADYQEKIRLAEHPKKARKLGRTRRKKLRRDWSKVRTVIMTRGLYTKCKAHPEVAEALLNTGDIHIQENSLYDYFWGTGRDARGKNAYGQVLMNIRAKLREELASAG